MTEAGQRKIAEKFFFRQEKVADQRSPGYATDVSDSTLEDLIEIIGKLNIGKAPGLDGHWRKLSAKHPKFNQERLLEPMNLHLRKRKFTDCWKGAKLIVVPKEKKTTYRPICLLNVLNKVYEGLIRHRVEEELGQWVGPLTKAD